MKNCHKSIKYVSQAYAAGGRWSKLDEQEEIRRNAKRSKQCDYIFDRKKDSIKQSKINKNETPLDEILYDQFSVGENMDKQSRASTRKSRLKILYIF